MNQGPGGSCADCNGFHTAAELAGTTGECPNPIRPQQFTRLNSYRTTRFFTVDDDEEGTVVTGVPYENLEKSEDRKKRSAKPRASNLDDFCFQVGNQPDLMHQLYSVCKAKRACYTGGNWDELQASFANFTYANKQLVRFVRSDEFLNNYNIVDGEVVELDQTLSKSQKPKVLNLQEFLRQFAVREANKLADSQPCFLLTDCFAGASVNEDGGLSYTSLPEPTLQGPTGNVLIDPLVPLDQCPAELENQCPVSMPGEECAAEHKFKIRWEGESKRDWDAAEDEREYIKRLVRTRTYLATDKTGGGQLYQGCRRWAERSERSGRNGRGRTSRKKKDGGRKLAWKKPKRRNQPWKGGKRKTGRKRGATKRNSRGQQMNFGQNRKEKGKRKVKRGGRWWKGTKKLWSKIGTTAKVNSWLRNGKWWRGKGIVLNRWKSHKKNAKGKEGQMKRKGNNRKKDNHKKKKKKKSRTRGSNKARVWSNKKRGGPRRIRFRRGRVSVNGDDEGEYNCKWANAKNLVSRT